VELSPETCRVKPLRRINAIVASCWNYFTIWYIVTHNGDASTQDCNFIFSTNWTNKFSFCTTLRQMEE